MRNILLIEDDLIVRENTAELLEFSDYKVITAANGKIGVERAKQYLPDIIICDIMMPELDGFGVLEILSKYNDTNQIPFIFLSAKTQKSDIRKGMDLGADDYITKPFDENELLNAIESRLAKVAIFKDQNFININQSDSTFNNFREFRDYLIEKGEKKSFKAGEIIYYEGNNSNFIFYLNKGVVKVFRRDHQGKELITALLKEEDFLGITSFTYNRFYQETATAMEDTELFKISKNDFKAILIKNPNIIIYLINYLTENISDIKEQLLQMAYSSVKKKTAKTILQFSERMREHSNNGIRISRDDLASVAGIAKESFIRTLSELKKDGLIEIEGRNIKIINIDKLKKVN